MVSLLHSKPTYLSTARDTTIWEKAYQELRQLQEQVQLVWGDVHRYSYALLHVQVLQSSFSWVRELGGLSLELLCVFLKGLPCFELPVPSLVMIRAMR